jgi:hypothetical protein
MTYLNLFTIYLPKNIFKIIIQKRNDLNLNRISTNQMDHYLLIKMTWNQIISYCASKKDHPKHNNEPKLNHPNFQGGFFLHLSFWVFFDKTI